MKKVLLILCVAFLLFASCKQSVESANDKEEYGSIFIDMGGGSHLYSIGENGLPEIKTSKMKLKIESGVRDVIEKTFEARDEKKYEGKFKVGAKLNISVVIIGKSGEWSGKTTHIVAKGDNKVSIRLEKAAKVLGALKFGMTKGAVGQKQFTLGFEGEVPFFDMNVLGQDDEIPSFCRDQKGRVYVLYRDTDASQSITTNIVRYTSEGDRDPNFTPYKSKSVQGSDEAVCVASDMLSGNVFALFHADGQDSTMIALVKDEALSFLTPNIASFFEVYTLASYNNVLVIAGKDSTSKKPVIRFYQYRENSIEELSTFSIDVDDDMSCKVKKEDGSIISINAVISDMFMDSKHIYCLYRLRYNPMGLKISTGKVFQYTYDMEAKVVSDSKMLVGSSEYEEKERVVNVKDESRELYGPLRFVGFSEERVFIADDGVVQIYDAGEGRVTENKNRLVYLSLKDGGLGIEKTDVATWLVEEEVVSKPVENLVFFSINSGGAHGEIRLKLKPTSGDRNIKIDNQEEFVFEATKEGYVFDDTGYFYVVVGKDIFRYKHKVDGSSISYTKDTSFSTPVALVEESKCMFYDRKTKDFYCLGIEQQKRLFRRNEQNWTEVDIPNEVQRIISSPEVITIYNDILYSYDMRNYKIRMVNVEKDKLVIQEDIDLKDELEGDSFAHDMTILKDVLYITYMLKRETDGVYRLRVIALDLSDKSRKSCEVNLEDALFYSSGLMNTFYIGSKKEEGKVFFAIDGVELDYDDRGIGNIDKYMSVQYKDSKVDIRVEDTPDAKWWIDDGIGIWSGTKQTLLWACDNPYVRDAAFYGVPQDRINVFDDTIADLSACGNGSKRYRPLNVFCYDQRGNLYVLYKNELNNDALVVKFDLKIDGTYDFAEIKEHVANSSFEGKFALRLDGERIPQDIRNPIIMAVDAHNSDKAYLYISSYDGGIRKIERYSFSLYRPIGNAQRDAAWSLDLNNEPVESGDYTIVNSFMTATANKDGFFIAVKEREVKTLDEHYERAYNIQVRKYPKDSQLLQGYKKPVSVINVIGKPDNRIPTNKYSDSSGNSVPTPDKYKIETIENMIAYNGKLYALSTLKIGNKVGGNSSGSADEHHPVETKISGTLWMLGATGVDFDDNAKKVIKKSEEADFAPCHIVGILPNEIRIASDGYYGKRVDPTRYENYDNVWTLMLPKKEEDAEELKSSKCKVIFNLALKGGNTSQFEW